MVIDNTLQWENNQHCLMLILCNCCRSSKRLKYQTCAKSKVLNSILFTNTKLCKIGYISDDNCSFCKLKPETLYHVLFYCSHVQRFWKDFEYYFYLLTKEFFHLTLQDVMIGKLYAKCPLLKYLLLIAKSFIWGCRRNQTLPNITAFKQRAKIKYETEKFICVKTNCMEKFNKKWALCLDFATFQIVVSIVLVSYCIVSIVLVSYCIVSIVLVSYCIVSIVLV